MSVLLRRYYQLLDNSFGGWLTVATKQAIVGAFGQTDGKAVIKATNSYLNGIVATDPTKAQALAAFINEDPMMVCSLGIEPQGVTMPIRLLANVNNAYILTDYKPNQKTEFYIKGKQDDSNSALFGNTGTFYLFDTMNGTYMGFDSIQSSTNVVIRGRLAEIELSKASGAVIDGTKIADLSAAIDFTTNYGMALFGRRDESNGGIGKLGAHAIARVYAKEDGVYAARFAPSIHNGQKGMYDIDAKQWYGNANTVGSFSISYLRNGYPWTPANQTH